MKTLNTDAEIIAHLDAITKDFKGSMNDLEAAIGYYMVARHFGWKPLLLIHDKQTMKKYEKILKLEFRDEIPDVGEFAYKSVAWVAVQKISSFWKAVKGEVQGIRTKQIS